MTTIEQEEKRFWDIVAKIVDKTGLDVSLRIHAETSKYSSMINEKYKRLRFDIRFINSESEQIIHQFHWVDIGRSMFQGFLEVNHEMEKWLDGKVE